MLVDTNLLVLYFVGEVNGNRVANFKRTRKYSKKDFDFLAEVLASARELYTVAHVMAEVSNLTDLGDEELVQVRALLKDRLSVLVEPAISSAEAAQDKDFVRMGLTDCVIARAAQAHNCTVLTDDLDLYLLLETRGIPVFNFTHLRELAKAKGQF